MKNLKKVTTLSVISVLLVIISSCKQKSEQKQYDSVLSSIKYKSYKTVSKTVIPPLIITYNFENKKNDSPIVSEEIVRLLLGYYWAISGNTTFAFAEGNIVNNFSKDNNYNALAHMLIAITMYEKGWKNLAKDESDKGVLILNKTPDAKYTKIELTGFHLILGSFCIYDKRFDAARFHFAGFASLTGFDWTFTLVDAMGNINEGKIQTGLQKIKKISDDPKVPQEIRATLKTVITEVEKTTGNVDSALFWPKTISQIIFNNLKDVSINGIGGFFKLIDKAKSKINI